MTSAAMHSRGRQIAEGRGYGLLIFASVLLLVIGFWNLIQGITAIGRSHVYVASAHYAERSKGQPTFINLDKPYPNAPFTVLIWGSDRGKFGT